MTKFKKILLGFIGAGALFLIASLVHADNPNFWLLSNNFIKPLASTWDLMVGVHTSNPTEADGGIYYNSSSKIFFCGINGTWQNCATSSSTGISTLNGLGAASQSFATTVSGSVFNVTSSGSTHTFTFPSTPTFNSITLTNPLTVGNGGTGTNTLGSLTVGSNLSITGGQNVLIGTSTQISLGTNVVTSVATGTSGNIFNASISSNSLSLNLPFASGSNTGQLQSSDWTTFNNKLSSISLTGGATISGSAFTFASGSPDTTWNIICATSTCTFDHPNNLVTTNYASSSYFTLWNTQAGSNITITTSSNPTIAVVASPTFTNLTTTNASTSALTVSGPEWTTGTSTLATTTINGTLTVNSIANCNGSQFLQITTGLFGCGTTAGGGGGGLGTTSPFTAGYIPEATGTNVTLSNSQIFQQATGGVMIGTTTSQKLFEVWGNNTGGPMRVTRDIGNNPPVGVYGTYDIRLNTSSSSLTTFPDKTGVALTFSYSSSTDVNSPNTLGAVEGVRDGNDLNGDIWIVPYVNGAAPAQASLVVSGNSSSATALLTGTPGATTVLSVASSSGLTLFQVSSTGVASTTNLNISALGTCSNGLITNSGGAVACNGSAFLTGNQSITLSGDITGSGATSISTTYNNVVPVNKGGTGTSTVPTQQGQVLIADGTGGKYMPGIWLNSSTFTFTTSTVGQISGSVLKVPNALTFNNSGSGASSGQTFDGSSAQTISYNTIGAQPLLTNPDTGTGTVGFNAIWNGSTSLTNGKLIDNGTVIGMNATSSTIGFNIQGTAGTNDIFNVASSSGTSVLKVLANGNVGIGSSTPTANLVIGTAAGQSTPALIVASSSNATIFSVTPASGTYNLIQAGTSTAPNLFVVSSVGNVFVNHLVGSSSAPTIATSTGDGTNSGTVTLDAGSTDLAGLVTAKTGNAPAANASIWTVTFSRAFSSPPYCSITSATTSPSFIQNVWATTTTTTLVLKSSTTALTGTSTYGSYYQCVGQLGG